MVFFFSHIAPEAVEIETDVKAGGSIQPQVIPQPLCSNYERPKKATAICSHKSRFIQNH